MIYMCWEILICPTLPFTEGRTFSPKPLMASGAWLGIGLMEGKDRDLSTMSL